MKRARVAAPVCALGLLAAPHRADGRDVPDLATCDAGVRARPADREAWRCYEIVGQMPRNTTEVVRRLERAVAADSADPLPALELGRLEAGRGFDRGEGLLTTAAARFRRLGDDAGEAEALSSIMRWRAYKGRRDAAQETLEELRRLATNSASVEARFAVLAAEASAAQVAGAYGKAWSLLKDSDPRLFSEASPVTRRGALLTLAYVAWATGRPDEAVAAYRTLIEILRDDGDRFREASVATSLLSVLTNPEVATPAERRRAAEDALDAARESGNIAEEATALDYLADFDGPGPAAEAKVARALELARESRAPRAVALALRAQCLYGDAAGREAAYREALAGVEESGNPDERARLLVVRSRMLWMSGPRSDAIAASRAAMDAAEATRDLQPDSTTRARRFAQWGRVYTDFAGHLLGGDLLSPGAMPSGEDIEVAFATLERMRARVLLDELRAAGVALTKADLPDADSFPSLSRVQAELASDEALLVYVLASAPPSGGPTWGAVSRVLAITREAVAARPVPDSLTGGQTAVLFTDLLDARRGDEVAGAVRLFADYMKPALETLPPRVRRLVVVPDRILFPLPFAALRAAADAPALGESFEISVVPSATVWRRERARPAPAPTRGVLAFVDPGLPSAGSAPSPERAVGEALPRLAFARAEGATAARRIGRGSLVLTGSEAVEAALRGASVSEFRVLHFAAHALLDDAHPDQSALVLAPDRADDGLLHIREIATLRLPGSVVVVSGCRSAAGVPLAGEGPMSLARAFFQAGARAVVGSLRSLRDDEAAAFFDRFYTHLADGASVAGAVRQAQHDRRRAGAPAAAWAGIVALGDGDVVPFPGGGGRWPMWLGLAIGGFAAVLLAVRARRRPRPPEKDSRRRASFG